MHIACIRESFTYQLFIVLDNDKIYQPSILDTLIRYPHKEDTKFALWSCEYLFPCNTATGGKKKGRQTTN